MTLRPPPTFVHALLLIAIVSLSGADRPCGAAERAIGSEFPDSWFYTNHRTGRRYEHLQTLEGKPAPKLTVKDWIGKPQDLADLKGKVVVVDFWATWCPPCRKAIPKNIEIAEKYEDKGVVIIGVHDSKRGSEKMAAMARAKGINYPLAIDASRESEKAWKVRFWPTYSVLDRQGIVRASGLVPTHVEKVVKILLEEEPADVGATAAAEADPGALGVPAEWLEGSAKKREPFGTLLARSSPPVLEVSEWMNSAPLRLEDLKGKVVMLDFWATWCVPCKRAIPHTNELHAQYADEGLLIIGVCHPRNADKMAEVARKHGIRYPICADTTGATIAAYKVNSYPDYYFIDRSGRLRIADCKNSSIDEAVKMLLAE